jgi:hypothetical protein
LALKKNGVEDSINRLENNSTNDPMKKVEVLEMKTQSRIGHLIVWTSRNFHLTCFFTITQAWILSVKGPCNTVVSIIYSSFFFPGTDLQKPSIFYSWTKN